MLTDQELQLLKERLSRKPYISEIAVFDAMWSEHCSYKSSKKHLATLYNNCLLYTSPSPRDKRQSRMPSSA